MTNLEPPDGTKMFMMPGWVKLTSGKDSIQHIVNKGVRGKSSSLLSPSVRLEDFPSADALPEGFGGRPHQSALP
jgi:hypothetical protein